MRVVLIHLGSAPPAYLRAAARQVRMVSGEPPIVVGPIQAARCRSSKLTRFRKTERLSRMGLGGFWRYTCERFFVLESVLQDRRLDRCLHLESDCLLYASPSTFESWLQEAYGPRIGICPLTQAEDTAAVMYVGSRQALSAFNDALLELVSLGPDRLLELHGGPMGNEMRMIHLLRTRMQLASALPTTIPAAQDLQSPYLFDPGSYGQLVDGTHQAPGRSFAGAHHLIGAEFIRGNYRLSWDASQRVPSVYGREEGIEIPLANLHVHSKRMAPWMIADPHQRPLRPPRPGLGDRLRSSALAQLASRVIR
jgi:hypothetical protein